MESIFEVTFKKYSGIISESYSSKTEMSDDQNFALKHLYIILRDLVEDIHEQSRSEKINNKNCEVKFPKFLETYSPKSPYVIIHNNETLKIQLPIMVKKCFKDLRDEFFLKIVSKDKPILKSGKGSIAIAGLDRNDKDESVRGIYIRIDSLIEDVDEVKAQLQHELQHIHMRGKVEGLKNGKDKIEAFIEYLGDPSEICAYAKEYAYRYHKKYPRDNELKFDKHSWKLIQCHNHT